MRSARTARLALRQAWTRSWSSRSIASGSPRSWRPHTGSRSRLEGRSTVRETPILEWPLVAYDSLPDSAEANAAGTMSNTIGQRALHNARNKKKHKADGEQLFERALSLQQSGVLPEAKAVYRQLLQLQPNHFNALYLLGKLEYHAQSYPEAETLLRNAVIANPRSADAHM